eukprot:GEMP01047774.1.p1 GENE.GEMP01047774.1~~GEMP01047774.1.p1  ORF type:complete len:419 (+),score=91.67 GEMP01047774.1:102-1358(+)
MSSCVRGASELSTLPWRYHAMFQAAQADWFFTSCEQYVLSRLFDWTPSEIVGFMEAFSTANKPEIVGKLLWRVEDRVVPFLDPQDLISMLQACMISQVREHDDPDSRDIFTASQTRLREQAHLFSAKDIRRICQIYQKITFVPTEESFLLFETLGRRLEEIQSLRPGSTAQAVLAYLSACARMNMSLGDVVTWPTPTKETVTQVLQLAVKMDKDIWTDEVSELVSARLEDNPSTASLGQLVFPLVAALPERTNLCAMLLKAAGRKTQSVELMSQLAVLRLALKIDAPEFSFDEREAKRDVMQLPNKSSLQHYQVSGTLTELGLDHDMEIPIDPYVVDIRLRDSRSIVEIDGPMHFLLHRVGDSIEYRYDFKTRLKHRLLAKLGHRVYHIPYHHWPAQRTERFIFLKELLYKEQPLAEL